VTAAAVDHDVVIIGAGFGGMGAAIELKRQGYDNILIVDREDDLGGTWHVNHYPGLAVDIPSVTYSYSFEPNPYWSRLFAPGAELKRYALHVADKYDLHRHMRFGKAVEGARWEEEERRWGDGDGAVRRRGHRLPVAALPA
jgi:cation diffusion facilitator CzcD-associated flavoprotein CzcO